MTNAENKTAAKQCGPQRTEKPCTTLDDSGPGKGYRLAIFDPKTDRLKGFLVSDAGGCRTTRKRSEATVFRTLKEVDQAHDKCKALPCPP